MSMHLAQTFGAPALGKIVASAFGNILPYLMNPWTRHKVLNLLPEELKAIDPEMTYDQVRDLIGRVKDDRILKNIAGLKGAREVHQLIALAVQPNGIADPQHTEALILTRALFAALLRATSSNTYSRVSGDMILDMYLAQMLPEMKVLISEARHRRQRPILAATVDLADVLRRAGQPKLKITIGADQSISISGEARIEFSLFGANAERFAQWSRGEHGPSIHLTPDDGDIRVSYGHEELDRMFLPDTSRGQFIYEFQEVPISSPVRIRVTAPGKPDAYCAATLSYGPRSQVLELTFGQEQLRFGVILTPRDGKKTNVKMNLNLESGDRIMPLSLRPLLRAMRLLARSDMKVILPAGTALTRENGSISALPSDAVLFDGLIWGDAVIAEDGLSIQERMEAVSEIHLLFLEVAELLEEQYGMDLDLIRVREDWNEQALILLRTAIDTMKGRSDLPEMRLQANVFVEALSQMREKGMELSALEVVASHIYDFGVCALQVKSPITDMTLDEDTGHLSGLLKSHQVAVLPAESADAKGGESLMAVLNESSDLVGPL